MERKSLQSPRSRYERWKITKLDYDDLNKLCPIKNTINLRNIKPVKVIASENYKKSRINDPKPLKSGSIFIVKCAYQGVKVHIFIGFLLNFFSCDNIYKIM